MNKLHMSFFLTKKEIRSLSRYRMEMVHGIEEHSNTGFTNLNDITHTSATFLPYVELFIRPEGYCSNIKTRYTFKIFKKLRQTN